MSTLHSHTDFDPEERAVAIVTELEREVLDEDQLHGALSAMVAVFESRQAVAIERVNEESRNRTLDRRRERDRAKVKGVTPAPLKGKVIQPAGVIPSR